jgi:dimethylaniline monooxygenase (N-oxide forming)
VLRLLQYRHGRKLARRVYPHVHNDENARDETRFLLDHNRAADEGIIAPCEVDYALHARAGYDFFATKRGVDHDSYAYQLGLDMGAMPSFTHIVRHHSWRVLFTWAMGPNFNTKMRLVGPWARPEAAAETMANELYHVVKRPGGWVCE